MKDIKYRQYIGHNIWHHWGILKKGCFTSPLMSTQSESLQYTGLPDKNGVEICEGDIVKEQGSVGKVVYGGGIFKIDWIIVRQEWSETLRYHNENSEIIGNIQENLKLLKE